MKTNEENHYTGSFEINGETLLGEIVHNEKNGLIILNVKKDLQKCGFGRFHGNIRIIKGTINSNHNVTLINNICVADNSNFGSYQDIVFRCEKIIWSNTILQEYKFNKLVVEVSNALNWSGLTCIKKDFDNHSIEINYDAEEKNFKFNDCKITFKAFPNTDVFGWPAKEEYKFQERLYIDIECDEKKDLDYLIKIKNKILNLICFAIKDNVNVEQEYLTNYDDYNMYGDQKAFNKYYLTSSEKRNNFIGTLWHEYSFKLDQLDFNDSTIEKLEKLEPIFNLYLSMFKYNDMPAEMVFLNIIQAVETFHARFFYKNSKDEYFKSLEERFGDFSNFQGYEALLKSQSQKEEHFIILFSRINDLLIMGGNVFQRFNYFDGSFSRKIVDTRNYYTHYSKEKESRALKEQNLDEIIYQLNLILQFHVSNQLGIDNTNKIKQMIEKYYNFKNLDEC